MSGEDCAAEAQQDGHETHSLRQSESNGKIEKLIYYNRALMDYVLVSTIEKVRRLLDAHTRRVKSGRHSFIDCNERST